MTTSILMTGASCFLGKAILRYFLEKGIDVHVIVRDADAMQSFVKTYQNIHVHVYAQTYASLNSLDTIKTPTVCFHLAACSVYDVTAENIDPMINANLRFGIHLLEKLAAINCKNFINTGTYWQHYTSLDYNPVCLYAAMKEAFGSIIEYYVQAHQFKVITLKLFEVYGPYDHRNKFISLLLNALKEKKSILMSPGKQMLNMTYIDDVVAAYVQAMEQLSSKPGCFHQEYFIRAAQNHTLQEIALLFEELAGAKIDITWGELPYRERQIMEPLMGELLPGWQTKVDLREGLVRTLQASDLT
jgi:nucleoside-diphosphate-sugar epimerase